MEEAAEDSPLVNGEWARGQEIKRRRLAVGIKSLREFSEATGVSRNAITAAEDGHGSTATYERLEAWLGRFDEEIGNDEPADVEQMEVTVDSEGVRVTVKAPVTDPEALRSSVVSLWRSIREQRRDESPPGG